MNQLNNPCYHLFCSHQGPFHSSYNGFFLCHSHPNAAGLESAKKLTESLLETVSSQNHSFELKVTQVI